MKNIIKTFGLSLMIVVVFFVYKSEVFGAFGDPFISLQVGTGPSNGEILTTDGTNSSWVSNPSGAFPFTVQTGYNSTSTVIGFLGGLFSTASSTFSNNLFLSNLTQGYGYVGSGGIVKTVSTSTLASEVFTATTFSPNSIITTNSSGNLIATGTQLTVGNLIATTSATSYFMGNVGIGTTGPSEKLEVAGNIKLPNTASIVLGSTWGSGVLSLLNGATTFASFGATGQQFNTGPLNFAGGADYTLGTSDNYALAFKTNNSEKVRITTAGNVGIGTAAPNVSGYGAGRTVTTIQGSTVQGVLELSTSQAEGDDVQLGDLAWAFPAAQNGDRNVAVISVFSSGATANQRGANMRFYTKADTTNDPIERMRITNTGNVGIGTAGPLSKFDVLSAGTANSVADAFGVAANFVGTSVDNGQKTNSIVSIASNDAVAADRGGILGFGGRYIGTAHANWASIMGLKADGTDGNYGGYLSFYTRTTGANNTERMRIDTNGNVGIGTTEPTDKLTVVGGTATSTLRIANNNENAIGVGDYTQLLFTARNAANDYGSAIRSISTVASGNFLNPRLGFFTQDVNSNMLTSLSERVSILTGGNVGIGTTTPVNKLDIAGGLGFFGTIPTLSSCGTSPAITKGSTDNSGKFTLGSVSTGCTLTFAVAKTNAPFCVLQSDAGLAFSKTVSVTAITIVNIGALSSTDISYICTQNNN